MLSTTSRCRGFTLIELLVTLALLALLLKLAVPSYRSFVVNQQLSSAGNDMLASLLQARSEAMRQGKSVVVAPSDSASWTSGWRIFVDNDGSGVFSSAQTLVLDATPALPSVVTVNTASTKTTGPFAASTPFFAFAATGFSKNYSNGKLWFTAAETARSRVIIVSNTGRARSCDPKTDTNQCTGSN